MAPSKTHWAFSNEKSLTDSPGIHCAVSERAALHEGYEGGHLMSGKNPYLEGKKILAVDDEKDVLDTIEEALEDSHVDKALDFKTAVELINSRRYDLAILDIMGVDGLTLLEKTVEKGIPTVMLTVHALNAQTLMASIRKGALSYLPKEKLAELDSILTELLEAMTQGRPTWKLLFDKLGDFFDQKFGKGWREKDKEFWSDFSRNYQIGKGIQSRLSHDEKITSRGI